MQYHSKILITFHDKLNLVMELFLILKIIFIIGVVIALYAVARNLDIIKIILIYWKDLILGRK